MIAVSNNEAYGVGYLSGSSTLLDTVYIFRATFYDADVSPYSSYVDFFKYVDSRLNQVALYQVGGIPYAFFAG